MRIVLALLVLAMTLSGCFSTGSEVAQTTSVSMSTSATATKAPAPLVAKVTDTMHLLQAPDLSPATPKASEDIVQAIPSPVAPTAAATKQTDLRWKFTLPKDLNTLIANVTLWVDVEGTVVGDPSTGANGCFWNLDIARDPSPVGQGFLATACGTEPLQIPNGVRALKLQFSSVQGPFTAGSSFDLLVDISATIQGPGAQVNLLSGSVMHDSQVTVQGIQLTVPDIAQLQGTLPSTR